MTPPFAWLTGAGLGAGAMYFCDSGRGRRRRALVRDQLIHAASKSAKALDVARRDATNRFWGTLAELRGAVRREDVPDGVLVDRVRSRLGRAASHPSAIEVRVENGCVMLSGAVLEDEVGQVLRAVSKVRGVTCVDNRMHAHAESSNIAALQGEARRPGPSLDVLQENWSPTTRMAAGAVGAALMASCLASRSPWSVLWGTAGFVVAARALTNLPATRIVESAMCPSSHDEQDDAEPRPEPRPARLRSTHRIVEG
jgi:hypothetical protein